MKFFSLGTEHTHRRGKFDKPSHATLESFPKPIVMSHQIHTYTELRQQIHNDLRIQYPEWVEPDGESSMRLMEMLDDRVLLHYARTRPRGESQLFAINEGKTRAVRQSIREGIV
jgi:hypothetical protein